MKQLLKIPVLSKISNNYIELNKNLKIFLIVIKKVIGFGAAGINVINIFRLSKYNIKYVIDNRN